MREQELGLRVVVAGEVQRMRVELFGLGIEDGSLDSTPAEKIGYTCPACFPYFILSQ